MANTFPSGRVLSTDTVSVPFQTMATFWRMNDMPMAVISGASRGALRSGLYAILSTVTLMRPQPSIATTSATRMAGSTEPNDELSVSPNSPISTAAIIAPSMNTSPCAKLISSRMP
jgi:hypothetical protein